MLIPFIPQEVLWFVKEYLRNSTVNATIHELGIDLKMCPVKLVTLQNI